MTYLDRPVLDLLPDFSRCEAGLLDDFSFDPGPSGVGIPWKVTDGPRRTITYPFAFASRAEIATFRRFVADRRGRLLGFWLPVYCRDFHLTADAPGGATEIRIARTGLDDAVSTLAGFGHLILYRSGGLSIHAIASVETIDEEEVITLAAPLANPASARRTLCGGLMFARFADDQLRLQYHGLDHAEASIKFVELPREHETAHDGAAPVSLYEITRGGETWRLAGWGVDLEAGEETWSASDIQRGPLASGIEFVADGLDLSITTDDGDHPFRYFLDRDGSEVVQVTIYEIDADDPDPELGPPIYHGECVDPRFGPKGEIALKLSSILRVAETFGPRVQVQRTCNHKLYDAGCGVNEAAQTTAGTLTDISSNPPFIEAAEFGAKATAESDPNWFALGRVTIGNQTRLCVGQSGSRLNLNAAFSGIEAGAVAHARAGCDKRISGGCAKFANTANFLGFPYLPNRNPQFQALTTPKPSGGKKA